MFTVYSVQFVLITKTHVDNWMSWKTETFIRECKNIRGHELFSWTLCNAISSSYSGDQITC